ncbi:MAG: prepilin-type N-terminal cleavage/methylation domain-containing protein [Candidatus Aminicenantes bacterium]|nr:MAG: prepilin-type N-terminal cleavage/methylation domain-containing protein [Candidatus Aminicenantes bacterium]
MKKRTKKAKPRGLTLVELLITVSVISLVLSALLSLYSAGQRYFLGESVMLDKLRDIRFIRNWITRDIKEAVEVLPSWDVYTVSDSCLILRIPSVDANGYVIDIENDYDHVVYRLNPQIPSRLERILDAKDGVSARSDGSRLLSSQVSSFLLSSEGVSLSTVADFSQVASVDVSLVAQQTLLGRSYQETLQTGVMLRNRLE